MNTNKKNKSLLYALLSIVLMIAAGFLLSQTINVLYRELSAIATLSLSLLSVFLYAAGVTLMTQSFRKIKVYYSRDNVDFTVQLAFLLIASGALLLCFNTGLLNPVWKSFIFSWPMLLLVMGAISVCRFHFITGIICAGAGKFFLIERKAHVIFPNDIQVEQLISYFWPAMIIVLGIAILLYFIIGPKRCCKSQHKGNWKDEFITSANENNDGKINFRFVFSGTEHVILDPVFKGGTIDATFGGLELDLRRTSLAEGDTFLYVNAVFGGVEITAPDTWNIEIKSNSFAGGVSDSRVKMAEKDRTRKLIIIAKCTFGGITIK